MQPHSPHLYSSSTPVLANNSPSKYTAVSVPKEASKLGNRFAKYLPTDFMSSLVRSHPSSSDNDQNPIGPSKSVPSSIPFAVCIDGTSQGYFGYEMENNRLLKLLQNNAADYSNFILSLIEQQGVLLVPQDVSMQNFDLSQRFLDSHAITIVAQSDDGTVFKTFNGILGCFDPKRENISILDLGDFSKVPPLASHSFSNTCMSPSRQRVPRIQLLREGQVHFTVPSTDGGEPIICPVGLILISDVFWAHRDDWNGPNELESDNNDNDDEESNNSSEIAKYQQLYKEKIMHVKAKKLRENIKIFLSNSKRRMPSDHSEACEQINNFIEQVMISIKSNPLWLNASTLELEVARDNITKTVLAKLYELIFAPKDLKKSDHELYQIIDKLWFVSPDHLDITCNEWDACLWEQAKNNLLKMNTIATPKEKLLCVLSCSKTIIFLLNSKGGYAGADDFLPHMIFAVIISNPPLIQCNIEYIRTFINPSNFSDDSIGEAFYYLTILESAVYFLLNITPQSLGISQEQLNSFMKGDIPRTERIMYSSNDDSPKFQSVSLLDSYISSSKEEINQLPEPILPSDYTGNSPGIPYPMTPDASSISSSETKENIEYEIEVKEEKEEEEEQQNLSASKPLSVTLSENDFSLLETISSPAINPGTSKSNSGEQITQSQLERLRLQNDSISFIAETMQETPPTYTNSKIEDLCPSDLLLLLEEYKQMAALLEMVAALKKQ